MKRIGLIGGMSWESTTTYYKNLNQHVARELGGFHSFPCLIHSMDFDEFEKLSHQEDWPAIAVMLITMAQDLEAAGVSALVLCSNTSHIVADKVQEAISIPLINIIESTAKVMSQQNIKKAVLLGTSFTMENGFYQAKVAQTCNTEICVPEADDRQTIHRIIYDELCKGVVEQASRERMLQIIEKLKAEGAEAVILGCTEIGMLIQDNHTDLAVLDTTLIHCDEIINVSLGDRRS